MISAFVDELAAKHVDYTVVPHPRTESARAEAKAVGVAPQEVAKTVVVVTDDGFIRAVVAASQRLDLHKLRVAVGTVDRPRLATEAELSAAYPGFELGAVPPFGGPSGDRVVVDSRLTWEDEIVLEAGSHSESIKLSLGDLLQLSGANVADISAD
jgi:Ala-tRNA(Pro) deacylase